MKKQLLGFVCLCFLSSAAYSQKANTNSGDNNGYNRVSLGYNAQLISSPSASDGYIPGALHGFMVGYTRGINLTHKLPLFLEVGAQMVYGGGSKWDLSVKQLRFAIPVNVTYRFRINDNFKLSPYTGFALAVNAVGRYNYRGYSGSLFDDVSLLGETASANRVQGTWQIGLNANYKAFLIGLEYGLDMNNYAVTRPNNLSISQSHVALNIGYEF